MDPYNAMRDALSVAVNELVKALDTDADASADRLGNTAGVRFALDLCRKTLGSAPPPMKGRITNADGSYRPHVTVYLMRDGTLVDATIEGLSVTVVDGAALPKMHTDFVRRPGAAFGAPAWMWGVDEARLAASPENIPINNEES